MDIMENQIPTGESNKSFGPLIGVIIIIVILLLGAFYIWGGKLSVNDRDVAQTVETGELAPVSSSDEIDAIESDLTAGGVSEIDFSEAEASLE
ncbi:MAG: hypothetical protein Q7R72_00485 [bacterium]|nr:hypothetical protein [bacterium]